jgi:hypothetical protein
MSDAPTFPSDEGITVYSKDQDRVRATPAR